MPSQRGQKKKELTENTLIYRKNRHWPTHTNRFLQRNPQTYVVRTDTCQHIERKPSVVVFRTIRLKGEGNKTVKRKIPYHWLWEG